jgi:hypothetical protein
LNFGIKVTYSQDENF